MSHVLYPNFLKDPVEYDQAESLWRDRWNLLVRQVSQDQSWRSPSLKTTFADGIPFRDGNPIFSAVCPKRRLGVRVVQLEPLDDPNPVRVWTDTFAEGDDEEVRELVVTCVLTDAALNEAFESLKQWITQAHAASVS